MLMNKTVNMSATCKATQDGENIMTLSGTLNADGSYNISRYVNKRSAYKQNREQMDADEEAFESVLAAMSEEDME